MFARNLFLFLIILFPVLFWFWKDFRKLFYRKYPHSLKNLEEEEFYSQFENSPLGIQDKDGSKLWKELLEKAWATRNFEIELYWKRANYFWLFQVPAFAAYFVIKKDTNNSIEKPDELFVIICLGVIFSTAWFLINKGSKAWQRHWEAYTDLLEIRYFGPLYQTVHPSKTFSVSKINEIVSFAFIIVWTIFGFNFWDEKFHNKDICSLFNDFNSIIFFSIYFTCLAIISMIFGYGRGLFKKREITMYKREVTYINGKQ